MPFSDTSIRPATSDDVAAIACVHHESTLSTYSEVFSKEYLTRRTLEERVTEWTNLVPQLLTLVACNDLGGVVGFVAGGDEPTGQLGVDGELRMIYLLAEAQGQGLGALLMRRFVLELRSRGYRSMALWVLGVNPARRFYERLGGTVIARRERERDGRIWEDVAYGWPDLSQFPG
jgi:ribosomal protein S18 acetylase RimI-like enzyme